MIKIICDSSANLFEFGDNYASVPLKVRTANGEYVDDGVKTAREMVEYLKTNTEKTSSSCPNAYEWLEAFSKDDDNICITISSNLSGSYNACLQAKEIYEEENNHKVIIIDSYCAGPELEMFADKCKELIEKGLSVEEVEKEVLEYRETVHTYFFTPSVKNLVSNGRIPSFVGKAISLLKISLIGVGSDEGKIKIVSETRTAKKAVSYIFDKMKERGYKGGVVKMSYCVNSEICDFFIKKIREEFPAAPVYMNECGVLCSYYVEENGVIVAFEGEVDKVLI
ncbi:MAG: DegV family protein [Erysipelotrichaceae bacterium]|nr:DegV family protein [Erysipelotrichaceae bacterium]